MKYRGPADKLGMVKSFDGLRRMFTSRLAMLIFFALVMAFVMPLSLCRTAYASENGVDVYPAATYGDFTMNIHPPGWVIRNNVYNIYGNLYNYPTPLHEEIQGKNVTLPARSNINLSAWVNLLQIAWSSKQPALLGGRYFTAINLAVASVHDAVDISIPGMGPVGHVGGNATGFGDIYAIPFGLLWDQGNFHWMAYEDIVMPVGKYSDTAVAKIGKDYWAYDTVAGLTWLDPDGGHEVSFCLGYMANTENTDTHYRSGDEFHVDYTLAQYFSKTFGIGLTGYFYTQLNKDSGSGYNALNALYGGTLDGLKSEAAAIGPAVLWTPTTIYGRPLTIIAKWLDEFHTKNRFKGGQIFLSASMPL